MHDARRFDSNIAGRPQDFRVLHVLDHSWPLLSGYAVRSRSIVRSQHELGLPVGVVTGVTQELDDAKSTDCVQDEIPYYRTRLGNGIGKKVITHRYPFLREGMAVRLLRQRILELIDSNSFNLVHAHSPALCGLAALSAARRRRIPFVYEIRGFWEDSARNTGRGRSGSLRYRLARGLEEYVVNRADAVVGIAKGIVDDLEQRGVDRSKMFHVPNGVESSRFMPSERDVALSEKLGIAPDEVVFGFIGSLWAFEGIPWLVHAIVELRRRGVACRLLLVGHGEDEEAVRKAIRETSAEKYITFAGRVEHAQIQRYYSVMDVLVYPRRRSRVTDFVTPLKPLEAMAQGKPVLVSGVGGLVELVDQGRTGLVFGPENVDEFCAQAAGLVQNTNLRRELGRNARTMVIDQLDWKIIVKRYMEVYGFAAARRPALPRSSASAGN